MIRLFPHLLLRIEKLNIETRMKVIQDIFFGHHIGLPGRSVGILTLSIVFNIIELQHSWNICKENKVISFENKR